MFKKILFMALIMSQWSFVNSQTISRQSISSAGSTLMGGSNMLTFNIGETVIPTLSAGGTMVTQGFEQPGEQIQTGIIPALACVGTVFNVPFTSADLIATNTFTAQLSDATGSFANPISIGTLAGNSSAGVIASIIPVNTPPGNGYKIRVVGSKPLTIGTSSAIFTVNTPPTITLTSPTNGSVFATNTTITVNASDINGPIAKVNFYLVYYGDKAPISRTLLGSSTTAPFSFDWINIVGGNYNIQAEAIDGCGAATFSNIVNVNVLETCTVLITSPTTGQGFVPGSNLTLAASVVSFTNRTITKVEFYKDNVKLGEDLTAPYTYSWMNVQSGSYYLRAVATDNMGGVWYSPYTYILGINPANRNASSQTSTSTVFTLFPNPTNNQVNLRTTITEEGNYNINIVDMMGRIVIAKQNNYAKGDLTESLDVSSLAKGIYIVRFVKENGKDAAIQKLIIE